MAVGERGLRLAAVLASDEQQAQMRTAGLLPASSRASPGEPALGWPFPGGGWAVTLGSLTLSALALSLQGCTPSLLGVPCHPTRQ